MPITGPQGTREETETSGAAELRNVTCDGVVSPDTRHVPAAPPALHMASREKKRFPGGEPSPFSCTPLVHPLVHFLEPLLLFNHRSLSDLIKGDKEGVESCKESRRALGSCREGASCGGAHACPGCTAMSRTKHC